MRHQRSDRGRLDGRPNLRRIVVNIGWLIGDKLLRMGLGLIVGLLIACYLGPGQFGSYSHALAFVALTSVFATGGLDQVVVRHLVLSPREGREILGTAFLIKLAGALFSLALASGATCGRGRPL